MANVIKHMGWDIMALLNDDTYGILVGTGSTAVTNDDYNIETKIAHGIGTGQLQYLGMQVEDTIVDGDVTTLTLKRLFTNASGATITINEVALIAKPYSTDDTPTVKSEIMLARDVISGGAVVLNGATVPVYIYIRVTA